MDGPTTFSCSFVSHSHLFLRVLQLGQGMPFRPVQHRPAFRPNDMSAPERYGRKIDDPWAPRRNFRAASHQKRTNRGKRRVVQQLNAIIDTKEVNGLSIQQTWSSDDSTPAAGHRSCRFPTPFTFRVSQLRPTQRGERRKALTVCEDVPPLRKTAKIPLHTPISGRPRPGPARAIVSPGLAEIILSGSTNF